MRNLVVIENSTIDMMSMSEAYKAVIPCLNNFSAARPTSGGCRRCPNKIRTQSKDYNAAKQCIAGISSGQLQALRGLLDARQIRVRYRDSGNRMMTVTRK